MQDRFNRYKEINNKLRANYWTGLRIQPDNSIEGRNWMIYICLQLPSDIMYIINEMLNWIPAGCWNYRYGCQACGFRYLDIIHLNVNVCSWQCEEIMYRKKIMKEFDDISTIMLNEFKQNVIINDLTSYAKFHINILYMMVTIGNTREWTSFHNLKKYDTDSDLDSDLDSDSD